MKTKLFSMLMCLAALAANAQFNSGNLSLVPGAEKIFTYKNLQLYPVYASQAFLDVNRKTGRYVSLEAALKNNKIRVSETGEAAHTEDNEDSPFYGSNTVSTLFASNLSDEPILLMAGEVVLGGNQDRIISQDMILQPHTDRAELPVFCVEHGRWSPNRNSGDGDLSFTKYADFSSVNIRKSALVSKDQNAVWSEVKEIMEKNNAVNSTGAYSALQHAGKFAAQMALYENAFQHLLSDDHQIIGMVAVTGGKIISCDLFATPDLFHQYFESLLTSYITEAISHGDLPKVDATKVQKYLDEFLKNESTQKDFLSKHGTLLEQNGKTIHCARF